MRLRRFREESILRPRQAKVLAQRYAFIFAPENPAPLQFGHDVSKFDPDGALPPIPESNASKSGRDRLVELAARENLTVRQLAQRVGGFGGLAFVGTPATIADQMEEWLLTDACDGFNILFPYLPAGLDDFVDRVGPELQRRGIYRREYEGITLRENLGLPRPENRFFPKRTKRLDASAGLESLPH